MSDKDFLQWIHDRLVEKHGENPNYNYMHRLRKIINISNPDFQIAERESEHFQQVARMFCGFIKEGKITAANVLASSVQKANGW